MTNEQFDRVEARLIKNIEFISERTVTAEEVEALATVVNALSILVFVRRLFPGDPREFE